MSTSSTAVLQDAADIEQLRFRLITRWALPRIEVRLNTLPSLVVQLAQHRIVKLSETRNNLLGEVLAGTILLGGSFAVWVVTQRVQDLLLVMIAALYAGLIGKAIGLVWTRIRLLMVLKGLQGSLDTDEHSAPGVYSGRDSPKLPQKSGGAINFCGMADDKLLPASSLPDVSKRPKVQLRHDADIDHLTRYLATHWKAPRIEILMDEVPVSTVQRAQHHLAQLSGASNCLMGGLFAAATLLGGSFYVIWESTRSWTWTMNQSWNWAPLGWVAVTALGAALAGTAVEVIWTRVRLLRLLRKLLQRSS